MFKKPYFQELCFGEKFFIAGIDIFTDSLSKEFLKKINITAEFVLKEGKNVVLDADLFQFCINNIKFKLIIARLASDVAVIGYPTFLSLNRYVKVQNEFSRQENRKILAQTSKKHSLISNDPNTFYSQDKGKMYKIIPKNLTFLVECWAGNINPDAEITAVSIDNLYEALLVYTKESTSIFDSLEGAKQYIQSQI